MQKAHMNNCKKWLLEGARTRTVWAEYTRCLAKGCSKQEPSVGAKNLAVPSLREARNQSFPLNIFKKCKEVGAKIVNVIINHSFFSAVQISQAKTSSKCLMMVSSSRALHPRRSSRRWTMRWRECPVTSHSTTENLTICAT